MTTHTYSVRSLSCMSKAGLVDIIRRHTSDDNWLTGSPKEWSRDELVSYIVRELPQAVKP